MEIRYTAYLVRTTSNYAVYSYPIGEGKYEFTTSLYIPLLDLRHPIPERLTVSIAPYLPTPKTAVEGAGGRTTHKTSKQRR